MKSPVYPQGTLRDAFETDYITPPTRAALQSRLDQKPRQLTFFDATQAQTMHAVIARLFGELPAAIDLLADLDERLAAADGNGWRYDVLPPDDQAIPRMLAALDESAVIAHGSTFGTLDADQQDALLRAVQKGEAEGEGWNSLSGKRAFEELLSELTEYLYSYPQMSDEIGYVGMTDNHGWQNIGLDRLDAHEPLPLNATRDVHRGEPAPVVHVAIPEPTTPMRHYSNEQEVDAVVIGTGAGGAPLLARLAAAGLSVVALEAGKHWDPKRDFATDEREQTKLFWRDERLSAGADPIGFGKNNSGIGVGGSTLHYTAYTPRPRPEDFRMRSLYGAAVDWPLSYDELKPYYEQVEQFIGVSGPSPYPWEPTRSPYALAALPLNGAAQLMQRGCDELGVRTSAAANAALSAAYYQQGLGWRSACTNRGFCQAGCSVGAKASMDVTYIPLAINLGAEVRAECFVVRIARNARGEIDQVVYIHDGVEQRQRCRNVFLCAGAVETPRFLLINELANSSGQVGRNFMAHVGPQVWGQFDEFVQPFKGIPGALISEDVYREPQAGFVGGYVLQSIGVMPVTYAGQVARGHGLWGESLREHMRGYNHTAGINILGDCLPDASNFLELSDEKDARGLPKPRIHFTQGQNEKNMEQHAVRLMRQVWEAAGARDVWVFPRHAHTIGTCRMGDDAREAVVNRDGRSFDVPNLYVVDNSVFPTALGVNPALTIMALSLRTAERFLVRHNTRVA